MQLTSTKNPLLQKIRHAASDGRPTDDGLVVVEGPHLVAEALRGRWKIKQVIATPRGRERFAGLLTRIIGEPIEVPAPVFRQLSSTENAQEIMALLRPHTGAWSDILVAGGLTVVLDGIQDPGNAGAIVRSAEAFGATAVLLLNGCANVANGKFLRATAGSIFRLPFLEHVHASDCIRQFQTARLQLYALSAKGQLPLSSADLRAGCALIAGSEASGVSTLLLNAATSIAIPTRTVESLNAAVACSVALYEAARQRGTP